MPFQTRIYKTQDGRIPFEETLNAVRDMRAKVEGQTMNDESATVPFDDVAADIYRASPELAIEVLNSCLADGSIAEIFHTVRHINAALGESAEAWRPDAVKGLNTSKIAANEANMTLRDLLALAQAMHMRLAFIPCEDKSEAGESEKRSVA